MKRFILILLLFSGVFGLLCAGGIDPFVLDTIAAGITRVQPPVISNGYITFTADGSARYTGIAFDFENFRTIYPFRRIISRDEKGNPIDSILFFIMKVPSDVSLIKYRLVIDGLWTTDPENTAMQYDTQTGMMLSTIKTEPVHEIKTAAAPPGVVRFVYEGKPGSKIRLAGSFNNWDSFMYELQEVSPGMYRLDLPLPRGTYYYSFFQGSTQLPDITNPERGYTSDGRVASIVTVR